MLKICTYVKLVYKLPQYTDFPCSNKSYATEGISLALIMASGKGMKSSVTFEPFLTCFLLKIFGYREVFCLVLVCYISTIFVILCFNSKLMLYVEERRDKVALWSTYI